MMHCKAIVSLILFSLSSLFSNGQGSWTDNLEVEASYGTGFLLPEYQFINLISTDYTTNYEFSLRKYSTGKDAWQELYNYPAYGIRFLYSNLGSKEVLGELWGIYPYFELKIFNYKRLTISNQIGLGYSRVNKKFDLEDNFLNVAVGSYGNMHFNTRFLLYYQLHEKLKINTSLSFDHFSNGNTAEPNLGINYLSWMGGISYSIGERKQLASEESIVKDGHINQELSISIGGKHSRALSSKYYRTHSFTYAARKQIFRTFHLGLGVDVFYDSSVKDQLEKEGRDFYPTNSFQTGIHLSQTVVYKKFSLSLHEGIYLGLREKVNNYLMYNRGILRYEVNQKYTLRFAMNSNLHILNYPELGIGILL